MSDLVLWGASGHGKVVLDVARALGGFTTISFIDDACEESGREFCGCQVVGASRYLQLLKGKSCSQYLVSIGKNEMRPHAFRELSIMACCQPHSSTRLQ
jgi:FlaA1/EpsC-like NDP-sugar epimerase